MNSAAATIDPGPLAYGDRETVLVVEDNPALRRSVMLLLQVLRYRPIEVDSAPAALDVLKSETVDLLFTDLMMPGGMNGIELARRALESVPGLRVLLTSGLSGGLTSRLHEAEFARFPLLEKPYRLHELAKALRQAFGQTSDRDPALIEPLGTPSP
jgi:CheY-like chemotaxis protein